MQREKFSFPGAVTQVDIHFLSLVTKYKKKATAHCHKNRAHNIVAASPGQDADPLVDLPPVVVPEAVSIRPISTLLCTQPLAVGLLLAGPQGVTGGGGGGVAVVLEAGVPLLLLITRTQPQFNYSPLDWAVARATRGSYDNVKFPYLILFRVGEGGGRVFH